MYVGQMRKAWGKCLYFVKKTKHFIIRMSDYTFLYKKSILKKD